MEKLKTMLNSTSFRGFRSAFDAQETNLSTSNFQLITDQLNRIEEKLDSLLQHKHGSIVIPSEESKDVWTYGSFRVDLFKR